MLKIFQELIMVPGISGYEHDVRAFIESKLPSGLDTHTDNLGNLVATLGSGKRGMLFVAHMDELGFIVSEILDSGFLKIKPVGGTDPRTLFGRVLKIVTKKGAIKVVVSVTPPHLMQDRDKETGRTPEIIDFIVDVGVRSRKEAETLGIRVLDFGVMEKTFNIINKDYIVCRGVDDRLGCAILLEAANRAKDLKIKKDRCVHFAFSVQEEVGVRGAEVLARRLDLETAFAVDSASASDVPESRGDLSPVKLGRGPCLRVMDRGAIVPRDFTEELEKIAKKAKIPLQVIFTGGGTDARAFQPENVRAMPIAFPVRYTHSAVETAHAGDAKNTLKFILEIIKHYAQ